MADYFCPVCRMGEPCANNAGASYALIETWQTLKQTVPRIDSLGRQARSSCAGCTMQFIAEHSGHGIRVFINPMEEVTECNAEQRANAKDIIREFIGPHCFGSDPCVWHWFWNTHSQYDVAIRALYMFYTNELTVEQFQLVTLHMGGPFMSVEETRTFCDRNSWLDRGETEGSYKMRHILEADRDIVIDPAWRTPPVLALFRSILDDKAFNRLPILADAIEEAGCEDKVLLQELRADHVLTPVIN